MRHFFVIMNPDKQGVRETSVEISDYLTSRGAFCVIGGENQKGQSGKHYTDSSKVPKETECVITLGGDGTLIQAARDLAGRNLPMLGINRGTLGYLTQVSRTDEIGPALSTLLADESMLEERMMLKGTILRNQKKIKEDIALNEIVISRGKYLKMLKFKVYVNQQFLIQYHADGLIVATPTGSTAYNLSAGGPILIPDSQMVVLTPICSHALNSRSIVLSPKDQIRIEIAGRTGIDQAAVFDGDSGINLEPGDCIEISRSKIKTIFIKLKNISFLENLCNKISGI